MLKSEIFDIFSILKMETIVSEKLPGIFPRIKMDGMEFPSFDQFLTWQIYEKHIIFWYDWKDKTFFNEKKANLEKNIFSTLLLILVYIGEIIMERAIFWTCHLLTFKLQRKLQEKEQVTVPGNLTFS